jgi:hypothetical protein
LIQVICVSFNSYKLLDGFLQDLAGIGSSFTSFFFCCPCPLMCLMCCSFYFLKLKLKADCMSSGPKNIQAFFGSPLDIAQSVHLVIRIKGEKMCIWSYGCHVYMFQSSLKAGNLTAPRMKLFCGVD